MIDHVRIANSLLQVTRQYRDTANSADSSNSIALPEELSDAVACPGLVIIPNNNTSYHNYQLGLPVIMVADYVGLNYLGFVGNSIPLRDCRYATDEEIGILPLHQIEGWYRLMLLIKKNELKNT